MPKGSASPLTACPITKFSFVGYPRNPCRRHVGLGGEHLASVELDRPRRELCGVLGILPVTMLRHVFTSPLNMYLRDKDRPKGAMKPMPNLMETELEFWASVVEDFLETTARH